MADNTAIKTAGLTHLELGKQGNVGGRRPGVTFQELTGVQLVQMAVFPDQMRGFKTSFKRQTGCAGLPEMSSSYRDKAGLVVRPELTKFWLLRSASAGLLPETALAKYFPLDLTGSKVLLRLSGAQAKTLINRFCAVDLSGEAGLFLATGLHHIPLHILKQAEADFIVFLPRSYAESLAETLHHTARQFGVEVKRSAAWSKLG